MPTNCYNEQNISVELICGNISWQMDKDPHSILPIISWKKHNMAQHISSLGCMQERQIRAPSESAGVASPNQTLNY